MTKKKPTLVAASGDNHEASDKGRLGLDRLIFFSDAVFAISITLLVLEIRLPAMEGSITNAKLVSSLLGLWPKYLAYVISFLVIGIFWIAHHRRFQLIERYDNGLLFLNLLELMGIAFIPFPTSVMNVHKGQAGVMFYSLVLTLTSLLSVANWWYASHNNRLVSPRLDPRLRRRETWSGSFVFVSFLVSFGLDLVDDWLSRGGWSLAALVSWWLFRQPVRR